MINLQNPSIPIATNPIEIDRAIVDLQLKLSTNLVWLTHGYGRAYKNLDATQNKTVFYPEVYLGKQGNDYRYTNISPDNDKNGQCFFVVSQETNNEFQTGQYSVLTYNVAIIFSANLELINDTLLETEYYQQHLVADVRQVLTREVLGVDYTIVINNVQYLFEDVFSDFNLSDAQVLEKSPLTHFRVNCTVTLKEECSASSFDRCAAILQNIDQDTIDCICGTVAPDTYSMSFDGVNERIIGTNGNPYNLEWSDTFSIGVWFKSDLATTITTLVSKWFSQTGFFMNASSSGRIQFQMRAGAFIGGRCLDIYTDLGLINANQWNHALITNSGGGVVGSFTAYINGTQYPFTLIGLSPIQAPFSIITANANLEFGSNSNLGWFMTGLQNNVRIWNKVITSSEALQEWNSGTPLTNPVAQANLICHNTMGNNAAFGLDEWAFSDLSGASTGYKSVNMEQADRVTDTP